ncbi:hypothetical protein Tco_0148777 [Tanacetum coccineum]
MKETTRLPLPLLLGKCKKLRLVINQELLLATHRNTKCTREFNKLIDSTEASGLKPRSNTKKNRILPAKKENKKEVKVHLRINKLVWTKVNRVDSSISSKRVVINLNSESVNSASHGMCVVNILNSVNATPTVRIVLNKDKGSRFGNQKANCLITV